MIDLQAAAGEALLAAALERKPLLALDFDGTLSPLVPEPSAAAIDPRFEPLLSPLTARMPVAIVSGRGFDDLASRVAIAGVTLVGNHGNEWGTADARHDRQQQVCREWAQALCGPLAALGPGLAFEAKALSLSIHYRHAGEPARMRTRLLGLVATLEPKPEIIEGKFVLNLMAPGLVTKYEAVVGLVARHGSGTAIFVGDDVTDERVFERAPAHWLSVRVWDDETPAPAADAAGPRSAAQTFVHGVDGVVALLERVGRLARNL